MGFAACWLPATMVTGSAETGMERISVPSADCRRCNIAVVRASGVAERETAAASMECARCNVTGVPAWVVVLPANRVKSRHNEQSVPKHIDYFAN